MHRSIVLVNVFAMIVVLSLNASAASGPDATVLGTNGAVVVNGAPASTASGTDFGSTRIGEEVTHTFSITNNGDAMVTISEVSTSGAGAAQFTVNNMPATVNAGESGAFTIRFNATAEGTNIAQVSIANDGTNTPYVLNLSGSANYTWEQINEDGFGNSVNFSVFSMAVYNGRVYAGTWNNSSGCEVWRLNDLGTNEWIQIVTGGFSNANNRGVHCMAVYNGRLYAGIANNNDYFEVWAYDETNWTQVADAGLGTDSTWAQSMVVHDGKLYMGSGWGSSGARVWTYDGATWVQINTTGFGDSDNGAVRSIASYNGHIYAGVYNNVDYCSLYRYDGPSPADWTQVADGSTFGDNFVEVRSLAAYNGKLYIGTAGWSVNCQVWEYDGSTFTRNDPGASMQYDSTRCMWVYNNLLYVGTGNDSGSPEGGQVWTYDAASNTWTQINTEGFGDTANEAVHCLVAYSSYVYAGVSNSDGDGGKVFRRFITMISITGCAPVNGQRGQTLDVNIVGTNTLFQDGVSVATFSGAGITVNSTTVADATHAVANITIDGAAPIGARDVNILTGAEVPNLLVGGFTVTATVIVTVNVPNDFDGDGSTDLCLYDTSGIAPGSWHFMQTTDGYLPVDFGYAGCLPVSGDFDGDDEADYAVYDPEGHYGQPEGFWYFVQSADGFKTNRFGYAGTVPVVGDFDGDGADDIGVYDADGFPGWAKPGSWYFMQSTDGFRTETFGYAGTVPFVGDFDGDGKADFGCYDAAGNYGAPAGSWYFMQSIDGFRTETFGYAGTVPFGTIVTEP